MELGDVVARRSPATVFEWNARPCLKLLNVFGSNRWVPKIDVVIESVDRKIHDYGTDPARSACPPSYEADFALFCDDYLWGADGPIMPVHVVKVLRTVRGHGFFIFRRFPGMVGVEAYPCQGGEFGAVPLGTDGFWRSEGAWIRCQGKAGSATIGSSDVVIFKDSVGGREYVHRALDWLVEGHVVVGDEVLVMTYLSHCGPFDIMEVRLAQRHDFQQTDPPSTHVLTGVRWQPYQVNAEKMSLEVRARAGITYTPFYSWWWQFFPAALGVYRFFVREPADWQLHTCYALVPPDIQHIATMYLGTMAGSRLDSVAAYISEYLKRHPLSLLQQYGSLSRPLVFESNGACETRTSSVVQDVYFAATRVGFFSRDLSLTVLRPMTEWAHVFETIARGMFVAIISRQEAQLLHMAMMVESTYVGTEFVQSLRSGERSRHTLLWADHACRAIVANLLGCSAVVVGCVFVWWSVRQAVGYRAWGAAWVIGLVGFTCVCALGVLGGPLVVGPGRARKRAPVFVEELVHGRFDPGAPPCVVKDLALLVDMGMGSKCGRLPGSSSSRRVVPCLRGGPEQGPRMILMQRRLLVQVQVGGRNFSFIWDENTDLSILEKEVDLVYKLLTELAKTRGQSVCEAEKFGYTPICWLANDLVRPVNNPLNLFTAVCSRIFLPPFPGCHDAVTRHRFWRETVAYATRLGMFSLKGRLTGSLAEAAHKMGPRGKLILGADRRRQLNGRPDDLETGLTARVVDKRVQVKHDEMIRPKWDDDVMGTQDLGFSPVKPRVITTQGPEILARHLPLARVLMEVLKDCLGRLDGENAVPVFQMEVHGQLRSVRFLIGSGSNATALSRLPAFLTDPDIACVVVAGDDTLVNLGPWSAGSPILEGDFKSYDQSEDEGPLLEGVCAVLAALGRNEFGGAVREELTELGRNYRAGALNDFRYTWQGANAFVRVAGQAGCQMPTGTAYTTVFSGLINILFWVRVLMSNLVVDERVFVDVAGALRSPCAELGLQLKVKFHDELLGATFLKGWFVPGNGSLVWLPLPSCCLKMGKMLNAPEEVFQLERDAAYRRAAGCLGMSYGLLPPNYPLAGALAKRLRDLSDGVEFASVFILRDGVWQFKDEAFSREGFNPYRPLVDYEVRIDRQAVLLMCFRRYGLNADAIEACELKMQQAAIGAVFFDACASALQSIDY